MAFPHSSEFTATVRGLTSSGEGVVELLDGMVCFVPGVWPQEKINFEVLEKKKKFARGRLLTVLEASPSRLDEPACAYHGQSAQSCGGCPWLFVDYQAQLEEKQKRVETLLLKSHLSVAQGALKTIQASELQWGYRTRAQFKTDGELLGFVPARGKDIVDVERCGVLTEANQKSLEHLRAQLPQKTWKARKGREWSTLDVSEDQAKEYLLNKRSKFQQANRGQNEYMKAWLKNLLEQSGPFENVLELFCGEGNFTEVIAEQKSVRSVWAVEGASEAVQALKKKILTKVEAFEADLFRPSAAAFVAQRAEVASVDMLFLDPPRAGLKDVKAWLNVLPKLQAVAYVSCDPATFFRDADVLSVSGFVLEHLQPVDLFPQTPHCELLSLFVRR